MFENILQAKNPVNKEDMVEFHNSIHLTLYFHLYIYFSSSFSRHLARIFFSLKFLDYRYPMSIFTTPFILQRKFSRINFGRQRYTVLFINNVFSKIKVLFIILRVIAVALFSNLNLYKKIIRVS